MALVLAELYRVFNSFVSAGEPLRFSIFGGVLALEEDPPRLALVCPIRIVVPSISPPLPSPPLKLGALLAGGYQFVSLSWAKGP